MKKRTLTAILCAVLTALLLASCSTSAPQESYLPPVYEGGALAPAEEAPDAAAAAPMPAPGEIPSSPEDSASAGETYLPIYENGEQPVDEDSLVTFSLKVDTASYTNVRRYIESGQLPPPDAVKVEEMINYFDYDAPVEFKGDPMGVYTEVAKNPFDPDKYIAFIRVKTVELDKNLLPPSSLTFLIDTSGSMDSYDKLPLLKQSFSLLTENLNQYDRVSIVTYAGSSSVVLDGASGADKNAILGALYNLEADGSTAGADGIQTAYELAEKNFIQGGNNRVILATDGDFNVGISGVEELSRFIGAKRDRGVYLSALGFGTGNLRDDVMETLAKDGDGNYSYIDSVETANKVLVDELGSNLFTLADDVKAQVEFNEANVKSYRLIGYENRRLEDSDFEDDRKDAGEIGVGTDVVVLFELELNGVGSSAGGLKYGGNNASEENKPQAGSGEYGDELFEVRVRYKNPGAQQSKLITTPVTFGNVAQAGSSDFNFACSVMEAGQQLRGSDHASYAPLEDVIRLAARNGGPDRSSHRFEYVALLDSLLAAGFVR